MKTNRRLTCFLQFLGFALCLSAASTEGDLHAATTYAINIAPGDFSGRWYVDGSWRKGPATLSLAPGQYDLRVGYDGALRFAVDANGYVSSDATASAVASGNTLQLRTTPVVIDAGNFDGRWDVAYSGVFPAGSATVSLVPAIHYYMSVGYDGGFSFDVDASGNVSSSAAASVLASGNTLKLRTIPVLVDANGFDGRWTAAYSAVFHLGSATVNLVPAIHYTLRVGYEDNFAFDVDADGNVSSGATASVVAGGNTLQLRTTPIQVGADGFDGRWEVAYSAVFRTGSATVNLVPAIHYWMRVGYDGGFSFDVDASGNVSSSAAASVLASGNTLKLRTTPVVIDAGNFDGRWDVAYSGVFPAGSATVNLVPAIHYWMRVGYDGGFNFDVDTDGNVSSAATASVVTGGNTLQLRTIPIAIDVGGYAGGWDVAYSGLFRIGSATLNLVPAIQYQLRLANDVGTGLFYFQSPCDFTPQQLSIADGTFSLSCPPPTVNHPPAANAGPDQVLPLGPDCQATARLDGTGSSDPDGDALTHTWTGPFGTATGATPTVALLAGVHTITLTVADGKGRTATDSVVITVGDPAVPALKGVFAATGDLSHTRYSHAAVRLADGRVLIVSGQSQPDVLDPTAEIYDPVSGAFTPTGSLTQGRAFPTATLLPDGKVLIIGGYSRGAPVTASLYDPATGRFSNIGPVRPEQYYHTATLLPNGQVLIAGGYPNSTGELYDPIQGTFRPTGSLIHPRQGHTATLLRDGRVLLVGGFDPQGSVTGSLISEAELYDPVQGTFQSVGSTLIPRYYHTATLMEDGRVLIASRDFAEIFDPVAGSFTRTGNLSYARQRQQAALLPSGKVALFSGEEYGVVGQPRVDLYDLLTGTFSLDANLEGVPPTGFTSTMLEDGRILFAGGLYSPTPVPTSEATLFSLQCVAHAEPLANAGPDQTVSAEVGCRALVPLDGSASSAPNGGALTFAWREGGAVLGTGATPTVQLGLGTHEIALTVDDGKGGIASDTVTVKVVDVTPPVLTMLGANPLVLECHAAFIDPGAKALDACAGDLTAAIQVTGTVNPNSVGSYTLTYLASDASGNTATAVRTVNVVDTTPPTVVCPPDIALPCSVDLLVPANFSATVADNCDAAPRVTYSQPPGSGFPVGTTTVTCTATDASGNASACSFHVTRTPLGFDGFLAPIGGADAGGGSFLAPKRTFKMNSTIPVKFTASCGGSSVLSGVHRLQVVKYTDATTSDPAIDATPQGGATTGNQFVLTDGEWHFNFDTKATGMGTGIWLLTATLSDGSQHSAWIQLK